MAVPQRFVSALIRLAKRSPEIRAGLEKDQLAAYEAIKEGNGAQILSASANGVSAAYGTGPMSAADWLVVLDEVLQHLENGTVPTTKTLARVV